MIVSTLVPSGRFIGTATALPDSDAASGSLSGALRPPFGVERENIGYGAVERCWRSERRSQLHTPPLSQGTSSRLPRSRSTAIDDVIAAGTVSQNARRFSA